MMLSEPLGGPTYPLADLYLYLPPDRPWVDDGTRIFGEEQERLRFDAICRKELAKRGCNVVTLDAPFDQRFDQALAAIAEL
jgi:HTH-type transcriptional repressor of NAD biosynthesis genes